MHHIDSDLYTAPIELEVPESYHKQIEEIKQSLVRAVEDFVDNEENHLIMTSDHI